MLGVVGRAGANLRRRSMVLVALSAVVSVLVAAPALGGPADDKRRVDKQLAQASAALESATARAREAGTAFARASQQLPAAEQAVNEARGEVAAAQVRANEAARVAQRARAALAKAQATLDASERAVEAAREELKQFVRASYQGGPFLASSAMLGARSPDQLIAGLGYLDTLAGSQRRAVVQVSKSRLAAAQERADVAEQKRVADEADAAARSALDQAQSAESAAVFARRRVVELIEARRNALSVAQQEKAASGRQYAAVQEESKRIAAALREAARRARGTRAGAGYGQPRGNGDLSRPVIGWKSSDFGMRYDPYYQVWQLHAGTDFAAPGGSPIWASAAGVVVRAGWNGGYGRYTCIYHHDLRDGRGLSTCYAHQDQIDVSIGEHVSRGERIGRVGTTGASTGNHLHFEVRLDGEPVNPLRWL